MEIAASCHSPRLCGLHYKALETCMTPRTGREKMESYDIQNVEISNSTNRKILKTAFSGIWSLEQTHQGDNTPRARVGHFTACDENGNSAFIGYGSTADGDSLSDVWEYDSIKGEWREIVLKGETFSARQGSAATYYKGNIYVFGGFNDSTYYSDFHVINTKTGEVTRIEEANIPTPRVDCYIAAYNDKVIVFGGFNGVMLDDMFVYDINTKEWHGVGDTLSWSTNKPFAVDAAKGIIYSYGGSKGNNLLVIDIDKETVDERPCCGTCPSIDSIDGGLVFAEGFLFCYGGKSKSRYTLVYAMDTECKNTMNENWWFVFNVLPDQVTTSYTDGSVSSNGLFQLPTCNSFSLFYAKHSRTITSFMGCPLLDPPPIYKLSIGDALPIISMRKDMMSMLYF